ncbi:hypothetical protein A3844_25060 [Paenibacillus helianthi]|uniref:Integrase n=1 Tax=Paenibacillus helianthi TaxID=1349432 RepID=A0ABX3EKQ9_9BACL|nr:tyrosine-type recombinase/integrase [Paenibacillus helianthi]OKP81858.1 hypothetical protein A3844_25060 [Paenibacillus helianthi]
MEDAQQKGKTALIKNRNSRHVEGPESTSLDIAFDLFYSAKRTEGVRDRTLSDYRSYWRYFRDWLTLAHPNITEVRQVTTAIIRAYVEYMSYDRTRYEGVEHRKQDGSKLSPVTVASRLRALQTMSKFWEDEQIVSTAPTNKIKAPRKDTEDKSVISDEQLSALLNAVDTSTYAGYRDHTLMMLLADSGLRINEALQLEASYLDIPSRCIRLPAALNKNRKPRIIPLSPAVLRELIKLLEENRAHIDTEYFFISIYGEPLSAGSFRKRLRHYAEIAGIDTKETRVSPHRFRDYFCTSYLVNGGDLFTLQRIVAHADIKTTQGYVKPNEGAIRDNHAQYSPLSRMAIKRKK